jgi:hypothetical protein
LSVFCIDRNAARQGHGESHVGSENTGGLLGLTYLIHPALLREWQPFGAKGCPKVMVAEHPKSMGNDCRL